MATTRTSRSTAAEREALGSAVLRFMEAFGASMQAAAEAGGYTLPQARLLDLLRPEHPMPMTVIARELHCDTSNATGLVDRLEQRGLIERRTSPTDRRVRAVALTREGLAEREALQRRLRADNPMLLALDGSTCRALTAQLEAAMHPAAPGARQPQA